MRGDALASGQRSATFSVAPNLRFDEGIMRDDLVKLTPDEFILKYMITQREYDLISHSNDDEKVSSFAEEMKQRAVAYTRQIEADKQQENSTHRECFLAPFVPLGLTGRVIVTRDIPQTKAAKSNLLIPRHLRKEKEALPTTGHIIKACVYNEAGQNISTSFIGKRVCFGTMSGTAICFKGYPTWIQLDLAEILNEVLSEDQQIEEEELQPMV